MNIQNCCLFCYYKYYHHDFFFESFYDLFFSLLTCRAEVNHSRGDIQIRLVPEFAAIMPINMDAYKIAFWLICMQIRFLNSF